MYSKADYKLCEHGRIMHTSNDACIGDLGDLCDLFKKRSSKITKARMIGVCSLNSHQGAQPREGRSQERGALSSRQKILKKNLKQRFKMLKYL